MPAEPESRDRTDPMGRVMFIAVVTFSGATAIGNVPAAFGGSGWALVTVIGCLLLMAAATWAHRIIFRGSGPR